ncbi:hypothetical protein C7974DRAFT_402526 [Boeremia exigua]|uniref:uncharacterized protein n=1 Tax=Boeremia exigua TaxID=749465 RepID=UPI001E8E0CB9|nr:uncharacterized protein C7974DRAFT_402526 [Boeremia exigua]KAH6616834.1 hypothetical protein C7974DRAFT_402526 [Boeremia exigua]
MATELTETTLRGTTIGLLVLTTLIFGVRASLRAKNLTSIFWHEGWLLVGYLFFLALCLCIAIKAGVIIRVVAVQEGRMELYPASAYEAFDAQRAYLFIAPALWLSLWSIKFALLAFYKKILANVLLYTRLWWAVLVYCVLTLISSLVLHITSCPTPKSWFVLNACTYSGAVVQRTAISFWQSFAVDLTSDLMIMLLPIGLVRNLQLPLAQKMSIIALFSLGGLCILASILRSTEARRTTGSNRSHQPMLTWLSLWSVIEASVAIIVGCGPGFYRKATSVSNSRETPYYNMEGCTKGSKGQNPKEIGNGSVLMNPIASKDSGPAGNTSSQEDLVGIIVTKGFAVSRAESM